MILISKKERDRENSKINDEIQKCHEIYYTCLFHRLRKTFDVVQHGDLLKLPGKLELVDKDIRITRKIY